MYSTCKFELFLIGVIDSLLNKKQVFLCPTFLLLSFPFIIHLKNPFSLVKHGHENKLLTGVKP